MNRRDKYDNSNNADPSDFSQNELVQIEKQKKFDNLKSEFIEIIEIIRVKHRNKQSDEVKKWESKLYQYSEKITEFLAEDWGYEVETFREVWRVRQPVPEKILTRFQAYEQWRHSLIENASSSDKVKVNLAIKLGKIQQPQLNFFDLTQRTMPSWVLDKPEIPE